MTAADLPPGFVPAPPDSATMLLGHEAAEQALLEGYHSGRLHHAWLIEGPQGIGKATLAFRFARFLLSRTDADGPADTLAIDPDHPVARQIHARAHPDLMVLERPRDLDGNLTKTVIPVDQVRKLVRFLGSTASAGGWRIVVVDSADELNRESANAILKMLEEPPRRTVFLLVAHLPGRLLPTIRSRCRRLALKPLPDETVEAVLRAGGTDDQVAAMAVRLAGGSIGRALELADDDVAETVEALYAILEAVPRHDPLAAIALAERLGRRGAEDAYRIAASLVRDWVSARMRAAMAEGADAARLAPLAEVWEKVTRAFGETDRLNLDRTQTLLAVFRIVSAAAPDDAVRV